jgi:hypothetical protein
MSKYCVNEARVSNTSERASDSEKKKKEEFGERAYEEKRTQNTNHKGAGS